MPEISSSYLARIKFDRKLNTKIWAKFITNLRLVVLLLLTITLLGILGYTNLPRRLNPEIKIPIVSVVTVLPGASPEDVESLITIPIENELQGLTGIDQLTSSSQDNLSFVTLQFISSIPQDKAKADVQSAVDSVSNLPSDATTPKVTALDFEDQPVWTFSLQSNSVDTASLMRFADTLKRKLENSPKIDRVTSSGFDQQAVLVILDENKFSQYQITLFQLSQSLKTAVSSYPAGTLDTDTNTLPLTIDPSVTTVEDIRNLPLTVSGINLKLSDIATVIETSQPNQALSFIATKEAPASQAVSLNVYKNQSSNIDAAVADAQVIVTDCLAPYSDQFKLTTILDTADEIDTQFNDLIGEFRSTILLVFGCLFLFLGLRQALIASITVPLTFLSAFFIISTMGMSINFLTLFALLLALGLLVDDTIVVVSAMTTYYKTGKFSPQETALLVWRDTIVPIWSTTMTTIWSFVPLLISAGIIGEFIKPIPIVVSATMLSSTSIAVLITLPFMMVLLKPKLATRVKVLLGIIVFACSLGVVIYVARGNPLLGLVVLLYILLIAVGYFIRHHLRKTYSQLLARQPIIKQVQLLLRRFSSRGVISLDGLSEAYHRLILRILAQASSRRRVILAITAYALIAYLLLPLGLVKNEFFPKTDSNLLFVNVEYPSGTKLSLTTEKTQALLDQLRQTSDVDFVSAVIGTTSGGFGGATSSSFNNVQFTLHLPDEKDRTRSSITIAQTLRDQYRDYSEGKLTVTEQSSGPPAGADLQLKILGDDLGTLDGYANQLVEFLNQESGVTNIEKSIKPGTSALVFVPDSNKLQQNNLSRDSVALYLRTLASGFTLDEINFDKTVTDKTPISFRFASEPAHIQDLTALNIPSPTGPIPLLALGHLETKANPTVITRESGKRTISVSASVLAGFNVSELNQQFLAQANQIDFAPGYSIETGGVNEENQKSITSILQAMIISAILILITMVVQFSSYRQAIIVLLVIPLAVSSVFYAFALTGTPLSFPALIGVLSLFGIVVTNSMFIVDKINLNLHEGMPFTEAIADAGSSRLEPIILTKLATVLGLLPITLSNPLWQGLGGAIISGILISSTIMLLFIPVVYYQIYHHNHK